MHKKYLNLIAEFEKTLNDSEIKNNQELTEILTLYKKKLEKNESYSLICAKLSKYIQNYIRRNKFKAPKALLDLYNNYLKKSASIYDAIAWSAMFF